MDKQIDIMIPSHKKDIDTLDLCIRSARETVEGLNEVYVVSKEKMTDNAIWVPETEFPFSMGDVCDIIGKHWRTGWYYAGMIHMTSALVIPNIKENVLILDSDTMFLTPTKFLDGNKTLFNVSYDTVDPRNPYYEHMWKLIPDLTKQNEYSGIVHHMLMQRDILEEMFEMVEKIHNKPFWQAYIDVTNEHYETIDGDQTHENGPGKLTSYELYFNYMLKYHPDRVGLKKLNSILAYKGRMGVEGTIDHNYPSRTSLRGNIQIIPREEELTYKFDNIKDSMEHIMKRCRSLGYDSVTFQNHTRQGIDVHKKINNEILS